MLELLLRVELRVRLALIRRANHLEHYGYGGTAWTGR